MVETHTGAPCPCVVLQGVDVVGGVWPGLGRGAGDAVGVWTGVGTGVGPWTGVGVEVGPWIGLGGGVDPWTGLGVAIEPGTCVAGGPATGVLGSGVAVCVPGAGGGDAAPGRIDGAGALPDGPGLG